MISYPLEFFCAQLISKNVVYLNNLSPIFNSIIIFEKTIVISHKKSRSNTPVNSAQYIANNNVSFYMEKPDSKRLF